jgi:hypothetical protein
MLAGRAREYIRSFGYDEPPKDTAMEWEYNQPFLNRLWKEKSVAERAGVLQALQPPALTFWYRQHPWGLYSFSTPEVTRSDPWFTPSSLEVVLDPQGRLVEFHAAPAERKPYEPGSPPDWTWRSSRRPNLNSLREQRTICARRGRVCIPHRRPPKSTSRRRRTKGRCRRSAS